MKIYDKRDDFNFAIVNFPFICSNIPAAPAYGVYNISQMIRYSRACGSYQDFIKRVDANKEATVPRVPFGKVEVIEHFTVATMTWLTFMEYLCHK